MPDSTLDHATKRFAERDPEELGFGDFADPHPPTTLLDPRPPLVFIPGNHEDFAYLERCEARVPASAATYPVSNDGRIQALRSGRIHTFERGGQRVRIGGVSGAANLKAKAGRHERCHLNDDEAMALAASGRHGFDILISHDGPDSLWSGALRSGWGSEALRLVVEEVAPAFAFFGHYNIGAEWTIGRTQVIALSDCGYERTLEERIDRNGIGILTWSDSPSFERLEPDWLLMATRRTWRHWGMQR
ncbi:MAG: hypothetical protein ACT4QD_26255 [Acidobacteriota bacterium]